MISLVPVAPIFLAASMYEGSIFLTPVYVLIVTAKIAPIAVTKIIPESVRPNHNIASGTHATDGIDCKPRTKEPIV